MVLTWYDMVAKPYQYVLANLVATHTELSLQGYSHMLLTW